MQNNVNRESEKRKVSKHVKNALILVGGLAITTTGAILIYKNWDHVTDAARNLLHKSTELSPEIADIQEQLRTDAPKIVHTIINNGEKFFHQHGRLPLSKGSLPNLSASLLGNIKLL